MPESLYYFIQQLINGLTVGSTYALIAIGYTMVYGIIGMINFAHGEIYMIGSYIAFIVIAALAMFGIESVPLMIVAAFAISMMVTSAYGYSIERVAYRPLRGGNRLIPLISAIGMSIFLQNLVRIAQGSRDIAMPTMISGGIDIGPHEGFHATLSYMQMIIFVVTLITMFGLTLFISRSRMGRACRACAEDLKMTNLLGINTNGIIALTFVIGAALAAIAGVLLGMYYGVINP
ncbi:MAG TPA: branched-chain amino acid ABC transporter permease LivH, partial [Pseudomonas sp.]|nr:branched-chain amino acid ABC transporter permease LivH [Pseudomonas sp.]